MASRRFTARGEEGISAAEDERTARQGVRGPGPVEVGMRGVTRKSRKSERLGRDEDFRPRDPLLERPEESFKEIRREGRRGHQGEATLRGRRPIGRAKGDGEPEPRAVDVGDAASQAGPVVIVVVVMGCTVMVSVVVMAVASDGMRVGVDSLRSDARESDDGREEASQELCRMESSHSPHNRPKRAALQKYCRAFRLRQGKH
jgi:hypothetical protein